MPDFTAHRHPALSVRCPECGKPVGVWCRDPATGQLVDDLHPPRQAAADLAFLAQHGHLASVENTPHGWQINPQGRARD
ncbi:zinc finger domain-containing protein [Roseinatronobacter monicus]|uniref:DNA-binding phage zinc finger domain-containing protein n=1 Tax=Roseinatronobacter monicus TaxID=393481 RepID=A0A543K3U2_9RHOB|nr:hypothetical protein BD293_4422 [Roseinatronobacter monicus]